MTLLLTLLLVWGALSVLGLVGISAVCRSGHVEDVARGFDLMPDPDVRAEVTR